MSMKEKPPCEYGAKCYRKNPQHFEKYSHPDKTDESEKIADVKDRFSENPVKIRMSPRTKMKQTTLSFPKKGDFSSAPKYKISDVQKNSPLKNGGLKFQRETAVAKTNFSESVAFKRKRKNSFSEKKKQKVKVPSSKTKASNCFRSNDSSTELVDSNDNSGYDFGTVQSTSWIFIKNQSNDGDCSSEMIDLKNKSNEEIIKTLFLVNMPLDFYSFYEFCKSINESHPIKALEICDLKLVGPFDVLSGKINYSVNKESFLRHWRFYYDPPEFQTVLATESGHHFGYWRDDPKENPVFLASNDSEKDCVFKIEAENIFGTVFHFLNEFIKGCDPFKKVKAKKLKDDLSEWANKNEFTLETKTKKMAERQKKAVTKTFHRAGIVVPVHPKTEVGYRPLIETDANLKRICDLIMKASDESEKESLWENLQPLINAANIANDECDFGNSLELGIDLFCMGSPIFHDTVDYLLSTAYSLLNRGEFEQIIKAHLKFRKRGNRLSAFVD